uniref:Transthyretin-like family protein n=1 Tax=Parastrongyloides trichosuri TaxID=131310 RepID=A0A0N4ZLT9_PARTI
MSKDLLFIVFLIVSFVEQLTLARPPSSDVQVPYLIIGNTTCNNKGYLGATVALYDGDPSMLNLPIVSTTSTSNGSFCLQTKIPHSEQKKGNFKLIFQHSCGQTNAYSSDKFGFSILLKNNSKMSGGKLLYNLTNIELSQHKYRCISTECMMRQ